MNTALFFPGQGSQSAGMMAAFADIPVVRQTFEQASDALGFDLWKMVEDGRPEDIDTTCNTQPIMLTSGVAVWRFLEAQGATLPENLAGHSLGEYTALTVSGSLNFEDAVRLVRRRGELMQHAVPAGEGVMYAVIGLDDDAVREACRMAAEQTGGVITAANFNAPGQVVIAGVPHAAEVAGVLAKEAGAKRVLPLSVSVPSHCPLMMSAAQELAQTLQDIRIEQPKSRVWQNADAAVSDTTDGIRDALARQLYLPVRWTETVSALAGAGVTLFGECGPGRVLAGLAKRIDKTVPCLAIDSPEAAAQWLEQTAA